MSLQETRVPQGQGRGAAHLPGIPEGTVVPKTLASIACPHHPASLPLLRSPHHYHQMPFCLLFVPREPRITHVLRADFQRAGGIEQMR